MSDEEQSTGPLLAVEDLHVEFRSRGRSVQAVNGLSYTLDEGETLAILGESGSGKSVGAQAVMGILDTPPAHVTKGSVRFRGTELLGLPEKKRRDYRGAKISMIFQDALSALNPVHRVGDQIAEMLIVHRKSSRGEARKRAIDLMDRVRIPSAASRVNDFPHQFSGGMRQRVMIAMALALEPDVLIADEPTTALDVTVQAQIMKLLAELQEEMRMGLILITHDLGVVADVADRIALMYAGRVVEEAWVEDLYARPAHPYAEGLLASVPRIDVRDRSLTPIKGSPPNLAAIPSGCPFHPRCPRARDRCSTEVPELRLLQAGEGAPDRSGARSGAPSPHRSACHYAEEVSGGR
ncbi:ABC transporter ATP-binding protein [Actinoallomurus iriomotensis]|uniref:ABC transporter ATP-binding protein n=1 Tax=Actinoallomurus iriomotensis TaxID=478107 RepID=A0A9W6S061_9ACTN|nr:ABC transporter ATP-binding protein [Actinoallomurus iriomotensis]GLY84763.1 ABC transporter ATP-binding protein [Actinoallomurus iriomotensis]